MKIVIEKTNLLYALKRAALAQKKNPVVCSLENVKVIAANGEAKFVSSDLETFLSFSVDCEVVESGVVLINTEKLIKLLPLLDDKSLILEEVKKEKTVKVPMAGGGFNEKTVNECFVVITTDGGKYEMMMHEDADTFPLSPEFKAVTGSFQYDLGMFCDMLSNVFTLSTDQMRPAMCGLFMDVKNDVFVATDAHRLTCQSLGYSEVSDGDMSYMNKGVILPADVLKVIAGCKERGMKEQIVSFSFGGGMGRVVIDILDGEVEILFSCIDARYPEWVGCVPDFGWNPDFPNEIKFGAAGQANVMAEVDKKEFVRRVKQVMLFANNMCAVKFHFTEAGVLTICSMDIDMMTEAKQEMPCKVNAHALTFAMNGKWMAENMDKLDGDTVKFYTKGTGAVVMQGSDSNYFILQMPVMYHD